MPFWTPMGACRANGAMQAAGQMSLNRQLEGLHQEQHGGGALGVSSEESPHQGC